MVYSCGEGGGCRRPVQFSRAQKKNRDVTKHGQSASQQVSQSPVTWKCLPQQGPCASRASISRTRILSRYGQSVRPFCGRLAVRHII